MYDTNITLLRYYKIHVRAAQEGAHVCPVKDKDTDVWRGLLPTSLFIAPSVVRADLCKQVVNFAGSQEEKQGSRGGEGDAGSVAPDPAKSGCFLSSHACLFA